MVLKRISKGQQISTAMAARLTAPRETLTGSSAGLESSGQQIRQRKVYGIRQMRTFRESATRYFSSTRISRRSNLRLCACSNWTHTWATCS